MLDYFSRWWTYGNKNNILFISLISHLIREHDHNNVILCFVNKIIIFIQFNAKFINWFHIGIQPEFKRTKIHMIMNKYDDE